MSEATLETIAAPAPSRAKDAQMRVFMVCFRRALLMIVAGIDTYLQSTAN